MELAVKIIKYERVAVNHLPKNWVSELLVREILPQRRKGAKVRDEELSSRPRVFAVKSQRPRLKNAMPRPNDVYICACENRKNR